MSAAMFRSVLAAVLMGSALQAQEFVEPTDLLTQPVGQFDGQQEVGDVRRAGGARFDSASDSYTVLGSGSNMWFSDDAFHFVWKKMSGDVRLTADIQFVDTNTAPHRKACLMVRQSLAADAVYADAALHGNGLTAMQYRPQTGAITYEIQADVSAPARLGLVKRGAYVYMETAGAGQPLSPAGGEIRLALKDPFYIGLAVCAHNAQQVAEATFSNVHLEPLPRAEGTASNGISTLEVVDVRTKHRGVVYNSEERIEAPNWSLDGKSLVFNSKGRLWRLPVGGGEAVAIDTGFATRCNNDHGFSPDGSQLAISDQSRSGESLIYILPSGGGTPREVTHSGPSYWHGWSPDGRTLAFCGERNGEFDVYTISVDGGEEHRLTTAPGLDDGPDYSPDGRFIYFNSVRSGHMQIWRMKADGSDQEQITFDEENNWFAHPSPDSQWIVFLSYPPDVTGHPENNDVTLRLMRLSDHHVEVLATLFGGQGTINVPSWSPDSRNVAFVSYVPKWLR